MSEHDTSQAGQPRPEEFPANEQEIRSRHEF